MSGSSDFTFCQVSSPCEDDLLELQKPIPDISRIVLSDYPVDNTTVLQAISSSTKDSYSSSGTSKNCIPNGSPLSDKDNISQSPAKFNQKKSPRSKDTGEAGGSSLDNTKAQKFPVLKPPLQRAKVPFEKGYSQMDWLKVTRTHPDLAGLKGQSNRRYISMDEVRMHKSEDSIWTVLKGRVYNISPYMKFHPGGADMLMKAAGRDCTALFNKYHAWVNAEYLLEKCLVGALEDSL